MSELFKKKLHWIGVDWGTTNLRAWGFDRAGAVLVNATSTNGLAKLKPKDFEPALLELVGAWLEPEKQMQIVCCGMVGARAGWVEAQYRSVPCTPNAAMDHTVPKTKDPRLAVRILPGICQNEPAEIMRGEETQIAGLLQSVSNFEGTIILPGTHCKWVELRKGKIVGFTTYMTGELFDLLATKSLLRSLVDNTHWSDEDFYEGIASAMKSPEQISNLLFGLRAKSMLFENEKYSYRANLSGMLIGLELSANKAHWLGSKIALIASAGNCEIYLKALEFVGAKVTVFDATEMVVAGLAAARRA